MTEDLRSVIAEEITRWHIADEDLCAGFTIADKYCFGCHGDCDKCEREE